MRWSSANRESVEDARLGMAYKDANSALEKIKRAYSINT